MAALLFVSAQLTLAYTVAGVAKIISPLWWNGSGLAGVLGTRNYGTVTLARVYGRHKALAVASSIAVIAFETTFVLAWLLPPQAVAAYLSIGVVFHIGVAVMMGLNTFLFAFLAAYPVTWYCMTVLT